MCCTAKMAVKNCEKKTSETCGNFDFNDLFRRRRNSVMSSSRVLLSLFVFISIFVTTSDGLNFVGERETYAKFPKWDACINASISFEFKTRQKDGLLMYTDDNGRYDYLQVSQTNCYF